MRATLAARPPHGPQQPGCISAGSYTFGAEAAAAAQAAYADAQAAAASAVAAAQSAQDAHHHEQGAYAHTLFAARSRDDAAGQAAAAGTSSRQAAASEAAARKPERRALTTADLQVEADAKGARKVLHRAHGRCCAILGQLLALGCRSRRPPPVYGL